MENELKPCAYNEKLVRLKDVNDALTAQFMDSPLDSDRWVIGRIQFRINDIPAVDAVEVPQTGIGDLSDGYHTFNGLYRQRLILFAALVKAYKDRAWKSYRHEDGELCFDGGWFIVGIDTPEGSYTYHYENKDFDLFDCEELPVGKHWDGHTEDDVTRLLSLAVDAVEVRHARPVKFYSDPYTDRLFTTCSACDGKIGPRDKWCKHCGARMDGRREDGDA